MKFPLRIKLLSAMHQPSHKGFTFVDLLAYIFVIGIFIMAMPMFLQSSSASNSLEYRSNATLPIRLRY